MYIYDNLLLNCSYNEEIFQTKVVQKRTTHILFSVTFFSEDRAVYVITWKNVVVRETTDDGIIQRREDSSIQTHS